MCVRVKCQCVGQKRRGLLGLKRRVWTSCALQVVFGRSVAFALKCSFRKRNTLGARLKGGILGIL